MAAAQSLDRTHALVTRFVDTVWNGTALDHVENHPDMVVHHIPANTDRTALEFREFHAGLLDAIPDLHHELVDLTVGDDTAMAFLELSGTPEKPYGAMVPTGRSFRSYGFHRYRLEDDAIVELWVLPNAMGMLQQLGLFPNGPGDMLKLVGRQVTARLRFW